jgi:riboflavin kinase / FMN adenylyltransferase
VILARRVHQVAGRDLALAVGNFDGVHRGHQAILAATVRAAAARRLSPAAMSFHPLPREAFARINGSDPPVRLMSVSEKLAAFQRAGIDVALVPFFDRRFAAQSPESFCGALSQARVRWLMVGEDFRFGAKRAGDVALLRALGSAHGFEVETMEHVRLDRMKISSTAVRESLAGGDLLLASSLLGRPYAIVGRVLRGRRLGTTLGFPTINVALGGRKPAVQGVFAVRCRLVTRGLEGVAGEAGDTLDGVANLGTNPVVSSENRQHLEVFLFDFSGDLYGRRVEVTFIEKIRDELKLPGIDALVVQMHDDAMRAKHILRTKNDGPKS